MGATDPDGDPARDHGRFLGATDPDGDPARERVPSPQVREANPWVEFELRDRAAADLVATLERSADFQVVIGIPAERWFTPPAVARLEQELALRTAMLSYQLGPANPSAPIIMDQPEAGPRTPYVNPVTSPRRSALFLSNDLDSDRLTANRGH